MKTTVDIPEDELKDAMRFTKAKTKRAAVVRVLEDVETKPIATLGMSMGSRAYLLSHFTTAQINALIAPRAHLGLAGTRDIEHMETPEGRQAVLAFLRSS